MIIARKILGNALSSRPLLRYLDSTQTSGQSASQADKPFQLSPKAQRALWANHFINTIINQPLASSIESPSLRIKLIDSLNPIPQLQFSQAIKKEMTGIFTKGVNLNQRVFAQDRILKATFKDDKLTFYPSILITKPVFRQLHNSGSRIMFQGSYGIGKTISIAFYIYLSNIINDYTLQAAKSKNQRQFYKYLVKNEFLPSLSKKFWYWSIDWNLANKEDFSFQRILAEQATDLTQQERNEIKNCDNIKEAHKKIHELYSKADFTHIAVLDQINHAVSFIRKWNQFVVKTNGLIDQANSKNNNKLNEQDEEKLNNIYQPTTKLISLAKQFTAINPVHYVLNSSVNIEKQLIETTKTNSKENNAQGQKKYQKLTFQLQSKDNNHQPLTILPFQFQELLQLQGGKIDFWQFFVNLIEERTKDYLTEQEFKQFKSAFLQYAVTWKLKLYYRFLHIRLFLKGYKFEKLKKFSKETKNEIVKKIIYDFEKSSFYQFRGNLEKFMEKGNTTFKRSLLKAIYVLASHQKDKTEKLIVDFQLVGQMMGRSDLKYTLRQYFVSSEQNKQMMPVEDIPQDSYKIKISWTAQDFMLISHNVLFGKIFQGKILLPDHEQYIMRASNVYIGIKVENLLNQLLVTGTKLVFKTVMNLRKPYQKNNKTMYSRSQSYLLEEAQLVQIFDTENFNSFDTAYKAKAKNNVKVNTIEQHFEKVLIKCAKNPGKWIASLPVKKPKGKGQEVKQEEQIQEEKEEKEVQEDDLEQEDDEAEEKGVPNNPSVDFALVKCEITESVQGQQTREFFIYTYDTTIAKGISKKEKAAKALLEATTKDLKRKISVRHHILCLKDKCLPILPVNEVADIYCSNIEDLKIEAVPVKKQVADVYEEVLGFVTRLLKAK